jgi:uncharacterized membrane protein HdeD (DUF308 family)
VTLSNEQSDFRFGWGFPLAMGIACILIGVGAISMSFLSTLASVTLLGACVLAVGIAQVFYTFSSRKWSDVLLHSLLALLYVVAGAYLIRRPLSGAVSLTLFLSIFYIISGAYRIAVSLAADIPSRGWAFFGGLVTLLLGGLILGNWPSASLWLIGLIVGVDLVLLGSQLTAIAFAVHRVEKEIHPLMEKKVSGRRTA